MFPSEGFMIKVLHKKKCDKKNANTHCNTNDYIELI